MENKDVQKYMKMIIMSIPFKILVMSLDNF